MSSGDVLGPGNIGSRESSVMCHFPRSELASDWPEWHNPALSLAESGRWWLRWSDDRREPDVQLYNDKKSSLTRWPCHLSPLVSIFLVCKTDDITHPCFANCADHDDISVQVYNVQGPSLYTLYTLCHSEEWSSVHSLALYCHTVNF